MTELDYKITLLFHSIQNDFASQIFIFITSFGSWNIILSGSIIFVLFLIAIKRFEFVVPFLTTIIGSTATISLIKIATERPRPELALYQENTFSFPSGHTGDSLAFYGFIAFFLWKYLKNKKIKTAILIMLPSLVILISLSRLYLNVHYLSDVLAGYLVGAAWLVIGTKLLASSKS